MKEEEVQGRTGHKSAGYSILEKFLTNWAKEGREAGKKGTQGGGERRGEEGEEQEGREGRDKKGKVRRGKEGKVRGGMKRTN